MKKAEAATENPKKAANATTWMKAGQQYLLLHTFDVKDLQPGLSSTDVMYILGSPKTKTTDTLYTVFNYDRLTVFFKNDKLDHYERSGNAKEFFPEHSSALDKATAAYLKAKELDVSGKQSKKISDQLKQITDLYTTEGYYYYVARNYKEAAKYFAKVGDIVTTGIINQTAEERATMLNDCGTVVKLAGDYPKAIEFFSKANELTPKLSFYGNIYDSQKESGDTTQAINTLLAAIDAFPADSSIGTYTTELINLYIESNQIDQALLYLEKSIEKDPTNVNFIYNIGVLYGKKGDMEKAKEFYKKALEIDPNDEGSNLNLGLIFTESAKEKGDAADLIWAKDKKKYAALVAEQESLYKQALPYLEKYAEVVKESHLKSYAYKDLRNIYRRLGMTKEEQIAIQKMEAAMNE
jgi:tetratricopeptide (TPR) repeat protein